MAFIINAKSISMTWIAFFDNHILKKEIIWMNKQRLTIFKWENNKSIALTVSDKNNFHVLFETYVKGNGKFFIAIPNTNYEFTGD